MTDTAMTPPEREDIDLLLPWYATERLGPVERSRVAEALSRDPELKLRFDLVDEVRVATVELHDALAAPSGRVRQNLFAQIETLERAQRPIQRVGSDLFSRVVAFVGSLSPRATAVAAGFALILIVVQAGFLAGTVLQRGASFEVASQGETRSEGSSALVTFAPAATAEQIVKALESEGMRITEGPYPGGVFRVRLSAERLDPRVLEGGIARLRSRADTIQSVLPAGD